MNDLKPFNSDAMMGAEVVSIDAEHASTDSSNTLCEYHKSIRTLRNAYLCDKHKLLYQGNLGDLSNQMKGDDKLY